MRFTAEIASIWNAKFHPGIHEGVDVRTDVRTIFSELKFLGCIDNQIFLPMVLRFARARAPLKTYWFHVDSVAGAGFFRAKEEKTGNSEIKVAFIHIITPYVWLRVFKGRRSYRFWFIRPVSNVALLPCRTQINLTRQLHGNSTAVISNVEFNSVAPNSKETKRRSQRQESQNT